ncbi:MAG: YqzL family protein [Clostridiales bacterium]
MLKEMMWSTFEKTGKIDFYLFYKEIDQKKEKKTKNN